MEQRCSHGQGKTAYQYRNVLLSAKFRLQTGVLSIRPVEWQHSHDVSLIEAEAGNRIEVEGRHKPPSFMRGSLTVPSNGGQITLSYWWYGDTNSTATSCKDSFTAAFLDANGNVVAKVKQECNTDARQSWQQVRVSVTNVLSNYAGQIVTLVFTSKTNGSSRTSAFFVDDVVVSAA